MRKSEDIVADDVRKSAITSQSIGVPELQLLMEAVSAEATTEAYAEAVLDRNVLGVERASGRVNRLNTLQRLYQLRQDSVTFRALRDLWPLDVAAQPLLAGLCAMTRDTVLRSTACLVADLDLGDEVDTTAFAEAIDARFPGAYRDNTLRTIASKASTSWQQTGHLADLRRGTRVRTEAVCLPSNVAYGLLLGHLQGHRGEALFDTIWARMLDRPRTQLIDLAQTASQRGMLEFRSGGGVIEVGFSQLLRPTEGQLL